MVELIGDLRDLVVFVTGTLNVEIAFRERLDLVLQLCQRSEAAYDPEVEHDDQNEDDGKDDDPFERIFGFVFVLQKELEAVIVDEDDPLQPEGIDGVFFVFALLFEIAFYLYDFGFVFDKGEVLRLKIGFVYFPVFEIEVVKVVCDGAFSCFVELIVFGMVVLDRSDEKQ